MAARNREEINIIGRFIDKFTRPFNRMQAQMKRVNKSINAQAHEISKLNKKKKIMRKNTEMGRISQQGFFKTMRMGQPGLKKFNEQGRKFTTIGGRMANRFRMATHGLRGFRMEMLGVMFFGMMLQRTFTGLLQPVMEAFGVFDLFRLMLLVLFLPVMEMIFPIFMKLMIYFMNLSDDTKKVIGIFVLFGIALGAFFFIFGSFALGIGSLILAFGFLLSPITLITGALILLAGMIGIGFFSSLTEESNKATDALINFGISGKAITKLKDKIKETWPIVKEFFVGMAEKIWDFIREGLPKYLESGKDILTGIIKGISNNMEEIGQVITEMVTVLGKFVEENLGDFIKIGLKIGHAILKGIGQALGAWAYRAYTSFQERGGMKELTFGDPFGLVPKPTSVSGEMFNKHFGTSSQGVSGERIIQENNFYGFTADDLKRELDDRDRRLVDDVRRLVKE